MKRRSAQERDEADARERAEARREALLAELRARQAAAHDVPAPEPLAEAAETAAAADPDPAADEGGGSEPG